MVETIAAFALRIVLKLRHRRLDRRSGAVDDDVRLRRPERLGRIGLHANVQTLVEAGDISQIATDLRWIDVDGAHDLETGPDGDLLNDRGANRAQAEVQHTDARHRTLILYRVRSELALGFGRQASDVTPGEGRSLKPNA